MRKIETLKFLHNFFLFRLGQNKRLTLYLQPQTKRGINDSVAQLVEHLPFKERVQGSSPC